ncbi:hypothetical protein Rumeso_03500 [Rubellimicrobium mesophilum DSM 19309]|uniref:Sulfotransferase n=1 Tax=Rubellimicrobium mesophilum DSM 19309 TaxID=442562 RepID=A0A017HMD4_9RHOB|nr:sulfotransferase [Rubellimicrobium mesophilum]EYD74939.1 hypothetical protein Rumeso_03500 [Rubellimicrobium mesophilum DSM 19309]
MAEGLKDQLRAARVGDLGAYLRRLAGRPYLRQEDFAPSVSPDEARRLEDLSLRARGDGPAPIIVLGIMPRSGTNFVRDILALHPDTCADPGNLYEFPLLHVAKHAAMFRRDYIQYFPRSAGSIGRWDLLAMLSGAWLRELQREAGDRQIVLKSPHVQNLTLAPYIFAGAKLIVCIRDGRDVVVSSMNTFDRFSLGRKTFDQLATEWSLAAAAILDCEPGGRTYHPSMMVVRYEELQSGDTAPVERMLAHSGLSAQRYDFDAFRALPVRGSSRETDLTDGRWAPHEKSEDFKPVGRWRSWSDKRLARFNSIAGSVLERAGYGLA